MTRGFRLLPCVRVASVFVASVLLGRGSAAAQDLPASASPAAVGVESVASADSYAAREQRQSSGSFDVSAVWRVSPRLQVSMRPVLSRGFYGGWKADLYQLAIRYDRPGRVQLRVEAGYLPSPLGILPLESRADQNPLITSAENYNDWLPFFEPGTPWVQLTAGLYPLAAQVTLASERWDLRGSVLASSSSRTRPLTGEDKPPSAPQVAIGGGITPHIGLRIGASFEHGVYARAREMLVPATGDRHATQVGLDADYSMGYTRLYADWLWGKFTRATGATTGHSLTITGVRTLTPRWYLAARLQSQGTTDALVRPGPEEASLDVPRTRPETQLSVEGIAGYRLTAALTLKAGYYGQRVFGATALEPHAVCGVVWTRRWR